MSLPKITHPTFKITIPSIKKPLSFRPYTVREEKLILLIKESENIQDAVDAIKQIITNCCIDKLDVNNLALFDVEYIFVKLRAKSVGEEVELIYNDGDKKIPFKINLESVEVKVDPKHKKKFPLFEEIGVVMKYPNFETMVKYQEIITNGNEDSEKFLFDIFVDCIDSVYDKDKVYNEFTKEDLTNFILSLPISSIENIRNFFETIPVLEHEVKITKQDKSEVKITLRGLKDFFIY